MSDDFRESTLAMIRTHDPDPDELRDLAAAVERLADRWEQAEDELL